VKKDEYVLNFNQFSFFQTGDVFSQSEMAKTLSEITKIDPQFNKDKFLQECEFEIIPAVLEVNINPYPLHANYMHIDLFACV
jgi:hypothetical protein